MFGYRIYWQKSTCWLELQHVVLACTTQGAVISEPYRHRRWEIGLLQQCGTKKKLQLVDQDYHVSCQEIADSLNINHMTVWKHLKREGYQKKLGVWVPHELTQRNLIDQITICEMLLKLNEMEPFLKRIITGDEKWVKYENIKRKRSWSKADDPPQMISKPELTANKVMLSVWWDWKGIVHYELLQRGKMS